MSDRFKFRVWNKKLKTYDIQTTFCLFPDGVLGEFDFGNLHNQDWYIVEQCTGLKDKNGTLIFEGDVVRMSGRVLAVWWNCDCACWMLGANEIGGYFPSQLEIIGNIHEQKAAA